MLRISALLVPPALLASSMGGHAADAREHGGPIVLEVAAAPARVALHGELTLEARILNTSGAPIDIPATFSWGLPRARPRRRRSTSPATCGSRSYGQGVPLGRSAPSELYPFVPSWRSLFAAVT